MRIPWTKRRIRMGTVMTWRIERKTRNLTLRFVRFCYPHLPLLALTGSVLRRRRCVGVLNSRVLAVDRNHPWELEFNRFTSVLVLCPLVDPL